MVERIVKCLKEAIDRNLMPFQYPSIRGFLYRSSGRINFEQVIKQLKSYSRITNIGSIPPRLNCFQKNSSRFEDLPSASNREPSNQRSYFTQSPQYQSSNHYNQPIFLSQSEQTSFPEQTNPFRKVSSMANMSYISKGVANSLANNQPSSSVTHKHLKRIGNAMTIHRQLSNPQLLSCSRAMTSSSSLIQLAPAHINSSGLKISPMGSSTIRQANNKINNEKKFAIIKQSQLVIYPPSQASISSNSLTQQVASIKPPKSPKQSTVQTHLLSQIPSYDRQQPKHAEQAQSIIMQLDKSQSNLTNQHPYSESNKQIQSEQITMIQSKNMVLLSASAKINPLPAREAQPINSDPSVYVQHYWKEKGSKNSSF